MEVKKTKKVSDSRGRKKNQLVESRNIDHNSNPLVSVIVRTKDRPETLLYALQSVERQKYRLLEIIIVNDGGDDISSVLKALWLTDITLQTIVHKDSQGRTKAGNVGIDNTSGEFIIFLDDDDWFDTDHIDALVRALKNNPEFMVAYAGVKYCNSPEDSKILNLFNSDYDPIYLMLENTISIHGLLFERVLIDKGCRLDESLNVFEDWDLWLQFAQYTSFYHVDQISAGYRSAGGSGGGWGLTPDKVAEFRQQSLDKWRLIWNGKQLDKALRWSRQTWLLDLKSTQNQLTEAMNVNKSLSDKNTALEQEHANLGQALETLDKEYQNLRMAHQAILDSTSWRMTYFWRYLGGKVKALANSRRGGIPILKAFYKSARSTHKISGTWFNLGKRIIHRLKEDGLGCTLTRVKLHLKMQLANQVEHGYYDQPFGDSFYPTEYELSHLPRFKIGIMAHIFYVDLFEEICIYLNNIPVQYTLMLSVTSQKDLNTIENMAPNLLNGNARLIIKKVPNRGRDIAPMLVAFRPELEQCEIMAHIHTKKSSYNGAPQFGRDWRHHLLDSMLGSEQKIRATLAQFAADDKVGIIYPESFPGLAYWAFTWLSNRHHAASLLKAMGIADLDYNLYVDFPAGSMFWARIKAMKPLFELNLNYNDFPEEQGQIDSTIQHAIERCLVFSARSAGMQYRLQYFRNNRPFFLARNPSIIDQYCSDTVLNRVINSAALGSVISFDIFDTLFVRPFASPDAVFAMLDARVERHFGVTDFAQKRQKTEGYLRERLTQGKDVSITDIYGEMGKRYSLTPDVCQKLKKMEIDTELAILKPRACISEIAKRLKLNGKRLILVSDMYLEAGHIHGILTANNMDIFDAVYISSEVGLRKDQGTIWQHVLTSEGVSKNKLLHIGDNEQSDIQALVDKKFLSPVHVMRPISLLAELKGGRELIQVFRRGKCWQNELMLGLIANRVSDFLDRKPYDSSIVFAHPKLFGYAIFGPILLCFISWLIKSAITDNVTALLFLSREGWLFNKIYDRILNHPLMKQEKNILPCGSYCYCSRTFAGLTAIETCEDFKILLTGGYHGSLLHLFTGRFGIEASVELKDFLGEEILQQQVNLPGNYDKILQYLKRCLPLFKQQAIQYRKVFLKYWQEQTGEATKPAIVDIGYSGTTQKALMRVLNQPLSGYYFVTNTYCQQVLDRGGKVDACFGSLLSEEQMNTLPINKYALLLETVLTSPQGQLKRMDLRSDGVIKPIFKPGGASQHHFDTIDQIHQGTSDFISDVIDIAGPHFYQDTWNLDQTPDLLALIVHRVIDIGVLGNALSVEDDYSGNGELSVLDFYGDQKNG